MSHGFARRTGERNTSERSIRNSWINRREVRTSKFALADIGRVFRIKVQLLLLGVIGGVPATHIDKANAGVCVRGV